LLESFVTVVVKESVADAGTDPVVGETETVTGGGGGAVEVSVIEAEALL
jgi:hypothetical protein